MSPCACSAAAQPEAHFLNPVLGHWNCRDQQGYLSCILSSSSTDSSGARILVYLRQRACHNILLKVNNESHDKSDSAVDSMSSPILSRSWQNNAMNKRQAISTGEQGKNKYEPSQWSHQGRCMHYMPLTRVDRAVPVKVQQLLQEHAQLPGEPDAVVVSNLHDLQQQPVDLRVIHSYCRSDGALARF